MKAILVMLVVAFGASALADNVTCNPVINVNGCCAEKAKCKPKTIVKKIVVTKVVEKVVEKTVEKKARRNRISLLAGSGPTHITQNASEVDLKRGAVGGIQYQRTFSEDSRFSWGVLGTGGFDGKNNNNVLGSIGYDF